MAGRHRHPHTDGPGCFLALLISLLLAACCLGGYELIGPR